MAAGAITLPELVRRLDAAGVAAEDVSLRRPTLAAATRQLLGNPVAPAGAWPLEYPITASLAWTALLLAVFVPLATTRYARPR